MEVRPPKALPSEQSERLTQMCRQAGQSEVPIALACAESHLRCDRVDPSELSKCRSCRGQAHRVIGHQTVG